MPTEIDPTIQFFSKYTPEQVRAVFGKGSSSLTAHQLQKRDPQAYRELKLCAIYRERILGPESIPFKERLTPEQLENKYKADRAAAQDNLIPLPNELAERLGLPVGTRVSWEQLQKTMGKQPI
jgi:hypothetical protein